MRRYIERMRRAAWILKQPLTQRPKVSGSPVSDLFVWRSSEDWVTFFELTDISGLFVDRGDATDRFATLFFFDDKGTLFLEKRCKLAPSQRKTLDLSTLMNGAHSGCGTFCVFHSHTPKAVSDLGSFIAERGYVSYRYGTAPLRSYVHGNLDAVSLRPDGNFQLLGSSSFLSREYRLQHELVGPGSYEIAIVNPGGRHQSITCQLLATSSGQVLESQEVQLPPRGCHVFRFQVDGSRPCRMAISSHLVMARPLVFRICNQKMDVFHG